MPFTQQHVALSNGDILWVRSGDTPSAYVSVRRHESADDDYYMTGVVDRRGIGTVEHIGPIGGCVINVCDGASELSDIIAEVWRHAGQHLANNGWEVDLDQFERE